MIDCRYYDLCCFTDDSCNGEPECPKRDHCQFYSPMPNVKALLALADRMEHMAGMGALLASHGLAMAAASIREACGEVVA